MVTPVPIAGLRRGVDPSETCHQPFANLGTSTRLSQLGWPPTTGKETSAVIELFKLAGWLLWGVLRCTDHCNLVNIVHPTTVLTNAEQSYEPSFAELGNPSWAIQRT